MNNIKYNVSQYSVAAILGFIEAGTIAIPEIQRPFVWKGSQVRDLIDSLYNGYPTGYLIIWQNPTVKLKNGTSAVGKQVMIDGQQRITSLMTAIAGKPILTDDYKEKVIRIAFNPQAKDGEERFAVQTPAHQNSKEWVEDISLFFAPGSAALMKLIPEYLERNPEADENEVYRAFEQLQSIASCQIGVITLVPDLDINEVTEIFVRINSQGKRLNAADFAMSKIASDEKYGGNMLRKAIDYFCHLAVDPTFYNQLANGDSDFMQSSYASKMKWLAADNSDIYDPSFSDMLRVSFMSQFGRGKLGDLVSLLSGRDFEERTFKEEIAEESFSKLKDGVERFINEYDFKQFVLAIQSAGYISAKLLNSQMTLDFAYTVYLMLKNKGNIDTMTIKRYVQKWFVLSTLTSRYIGSPESQMDRDLRRINERGFEAFLEENEAALLSESFWDIGLPQSLETSSINSPFFNTFIAAQVHGGDRSLLSNSAKVSDLISVAGDVHHIFPKEYLKKNGLNDKSKYNQVANYTYLDTGVNISISDSAPNDYFSRAEEQCQTKICKVGTILDADEYKDNLQLNCIPEDVASMTYEDYERFLSERRKMMAAKIRDYYYSL